MQYKTIAGLLICATLYALILLLGCEKQLPDAYQDESFSIKSLDDRACDLLSRKVIVTDTVITNGDTTYVPRTLYWPAHSLLLDAVIDSSLYDSSETYVIPHEFSDLVQKLDTLVLDTTLLVSYPNDADTSFAVFTPNQAGIFNFYTSWTFTDENKDAYVSIDLFNSQGSLEPSSNHINLETTAGCTEVFHSSAGTEEIIPKIRGRSRFNLSDQPYIVRLLNSEPAEVESLRIVILPVY